MTTLLLWFLANLWSWLRHDVIDSACRNAQTTVGFPVPFYINDETVPRAEFFPLGILLDLSLGITLALILAWIAQAIAASGETT